jgi:hypothetical protein
LSVAQKENQEAISIFRKFVLKCVYWCPQRYKGERLILIDVYVLVEMTKTLDDSVWHCMRLRKRWRWGTNEYEHLRLQKDTVALWLKLRFVQIETMVNCWEDEERRATKRLSMNESSDER